MGKTIHAESHAKQKFTLLKNTDFLVAQKHKNAENVLHDLMATAEQEFKNIF